jgi:hypothetical protein
MPDHWPRFLELIRDLDPETREIVGDLIRRWAPLEEIIKVIEKRRRSKGSAKKEGWHVRATRRCSTATGALVCRSRVAMAKPYRVRGARGALDGVVALALAEIQAPQWCDAGSLPILGPADLASPAFLPPRMVGT